MRVSRHIVCPVVDILARRCSDMPARMLDDFHLMEPASKREESELQDRLETRLITELKQAEPKMYAPRSPLQAAVVVRVVVADPADGDGVGVALSWATAWT